MEVALVQLAADAMPALPHSPRVNEIPFDSQRKRLSTVHAAPEGPVLYCKGAPEVVLAALHSRGDGWRQPSSFRPSLAATFRTAAEAMARERPARSRLRLARAAGEFRAGETRKRR